VKAQSSTDRGQPGQPARGVTHVTNGGKLASNKNQATLDTTGSGPGPISVRSTVFDDQQLNASAVTTVNVEAPPPPMPTAQQLTSLTSNRPALCDNRSKGRPG